MPPLRTAEELRADLSRSGRTIRDLAKEIGRQDEYHQVYAVVTGRNKGVRGTSHDIAVALGLKTGSAGGAR